MHERHGSYNATFGSRGRNQHNGDQNGRHAGQQQHDRKALLVQNQGSVPAYLATTSDVAVGSGYVLAAGALHGLVDVGPMVDHHGRSVGDDSVHRG